MDLRVIQAERNSESPEQKAITDKFAHEVIDEIYTDVRTAVNKEVGQVDKLFLAEAASEKKAVYEIELTNLLKDKDAAERLLQKRREVQEFLERAKKEFYDSVT